MSSLNTAYRGLFFQVEAKPELLSWVAEYFPSSSVPSPPDRLWRVHCRAESLPVEGAPTKVVDGFTFDGKFSQNKAGLDPQGRLWLEDEETEGLGYRLSPEERLVEVFSTAEEPPTRVALMRTVRELATSAAIADGLLPLHGSAFLRADGTAVAMSGPRGAGKSSLLVHSLRSGATYLANDRVMLDSSAPCVAYGMPTIISLRKTMLPLFPDLHDELRAEAEASTGPAVGMTPVRLNRLVGGRPMADQAPLGMLLFPRVDPTIEGLQFERLDAENAAQILRSNLLKGCDPIRSSEVFCFGPTRPTLEPEQEAETALRLARAAPAYRCLVGKNAFDQPWNGFP